MVKHNNVLPNAHFHKDWQRRVKTWFDQPGQKKRRQSLRLKKAAAIAPRPLDLLRPAVRCPTLKYNTKLRAGRGFTIEELKLAGIRKKEALTIGIPVDHRRKNRSVEGLEMNVARLTEYKAKLVVFPKNALKPKHGDTTDAHILDNVTQVRGTIMPIRNNDKNEAVHAIAKIEGSKLHAYQALRQARSDKKYRGKREKIVKDKAEEEKNSKK